MKHALRENEDIIRVAYITWDIVCGGGKNGLYRFILTSYFNSRRGAEALEPVLEHEQTDKPKDPLFSPLNSQNKG